MTCAALAATCIVASVTFRPFETDLWQHLLVGKAIWAQHRVPTEQLWSWPTYGAPDTTSSYSWAFRALLWPVWSVGGILGLQLWRWVATLATFALAWRVGRVLGARGLTSLVVLVFCALIYRQRSQVRPETLASLLLALELLWLERRRHGTPVNGGWLVLLLWAWVNVHVSWVLGMFVLAVFAVAELRAGPKGRAWPLWQIGLAALGVGFINPYGWRAMWQPFHFVAMMREPLLRSIGELRGVDWRFNLRNGLPLLLVGWPAVALWRWRRGRGDLVEVVLAIALVAMTLKTSRFVGFLAVGACGYLCRDLSGWFASFPPRPPWARAGVASLAMMAMLPLELARPDLRPGITLIPSSIPTAACDFIQAQGIRGRAFNSFEFGGYLLWRFWPEQDRLPFMDVHQSGTQAERWIYLTSQFRPEAWKQLAESYRLDWCLLRRQHAIGDRLLDFVDADTTWSLVFVDDVAAVYVHRGGALDRVATRFAYRALPGGTERLAALDTLLASESGRSTLRTEITCSIESSTQCSSAWSQLSVLEYREGRFDAAREALLHAHSIDPDVPRFAERLQRIESAKSAGQ